VNLPGSAWNAASRRIVFSSAREPHDEIFIIDENGGLGDEQRITTRPGFVAYEPSLSPDGQWVVFESHLLDVEENGVIMKHRVDGSGGFVALTSGTDDCRQPNWAPHGDRIVYQRLSRRQWDLWIIDVDGSHPHPVTSGPGDKTDASFSPDGEWIVYSSDEARLELATLFIIPATGGTPIRVTDHDGYAGAPSWSPGGTQIAFETSPGEPDGSRGTTLRLAEVPGR
jgi:TolB protein